MSKVTLELLKKIFQGTPNAKLTRFVAPFNTILPKYGIDTKKRFAAFIANVGIESDRLKTTREYGGASYFLKYNGRKGLGNVRDGDGPRYLGRSVLQTTGRYNYWRVVVAYLRVITGKNWDSKLANSNFDVYLKTPEYTALLKEADKYNVNFLAHPEMLEQFPHAVEAAGVFVQDNDLNDFADRGLFFSYAGVLNTGSAKRRANHYPERLALYEKALKVIPDDFHLVLVPVKASVALTGSSKPLNEPLNEPLNNGLETTETSQVTETPTGATVETAKNEQNVNEVVKQPGPEPYQGVGFWAVIKRDLAAATGGNLTFEGISQYAQQASGWPEWVVAIIGKVAVGALVATVGYFVFRVVHYVIDSYKQSKKTHTEAMINTDITRKNIEFTEATK